MKTMYFSLISAMCILVLFGSSCCNKNESCKNECGKKEDSTTVVLPPSTENMKKIIRAEVNIKSDQVENFILQTKELIEKSRAEEGNISYTLYQNPSVKTNFIFFEEWKDQKAIDYHFATEHFKKFGSTTGDYTSSPSVITIYDVASQK